MPVIKASDHDRSIHGVAFNLDDMGVRANDYLKQVRGEAAKIIASAKSEATRIRKQAEVDGRHAGEQAVEQTVQAQVAKQMETVLPALRQTVQDINHAKQAWLGHWEESAVHVSALIAARIIRRQLAETPEITLTYVREALELADACSALRLHLHPDDLTAMGPQVHLLLKELGLVATAELVADAQISRGGCRVETEFGTIDQQIEAQLRRIEEELT